MGQPCNLLLINRNPTSVWPSSLGLFPCAVAPLLWIFVQIFTNAQMQLTNQTKDLHLEQQMLCFYEFKLPRFGRYLLSVYKANEYCTCWILWLSLPYSTVTPWQLNWNAVILDWTLWTKCIFIEHGGQQHGVELHSMYWQEEPYWQHLISYMGWFVGVV